MLLILQDQLEDLFQVCIMMEAIAPHLLILQKCIDSEQKIQKYNHNRCVCIIFQEILQLIT